MKKNYTDVTNWINGSFLFYKYTGLSYSYKAHVKHSDILV